MQIGNNDKDERNKLPITKNEVVNAIKTLKDGKSSGRHNISNEIIKYGGEALKNILMELKIKNPKSWNKNECLSQWTQSLVIPIPKKGNVKITEHLA